MPTYDYLCEVCGNRFDAWQKFSDDPITVCPKCAGHVRRVIHPVGLVFKGGGFYINDTRGSGSTARSAATEDGAQGEKAEKAETAATSGAAKSDAGASAASASAQGKSEGGKSESKPATGGGGEVAASKTAS